MPMTGMKFTKIPIFFLSTPRKASLVRVWQPNPTVPDKVQGKFINPTMPIVSRRFIVHDISVLNRIYQKNKATLKSLHLVLFRSCTLSQIQTEWHGNGKSSQLTSVPE
jgi:hypothetical protein